MSWKNTWILVGLAAALYAFIFLFERRLSPSGSVVPVKALFSQFKPTSAAVLQIRRGNQFTLALERTNSAWQFTKPVFYPAADFAVQSFLQTLERIIPATHISAREIRERKQTRADFGFDSPPSVVVTLKRGSDSSELRIGNRTPAGDQVYVEVDGQVGYFVVSAELLEKLPRTQNDWRDTSLFHFAEQKVERAEVTHGGAGFVLALDPTNKLWRLAKPFSLRADQLQVRQLLSKLQVARAIEFVTDDARVDLDAFGLQTPEYELTLEGGSLPQKIQFGRSPTNDPGRVYARILAHTNIVLVPRPVVDPLNTSYSDLRDRQLVAFAPELVDSIDVRGAESFTVRRNPTGGWMAGAVQADPSFVPQWLTRLSQLVVSRFVKDVVTDFSEYGLAPAQRQYALRMTITNAAGPTNIVIAQLEFGNESQDGGVFVRRSDEDSVYAIRTGDYSYMPSAAWQFQDRRIWRFTTNQVSKITVVQNGEAREVLRQPSGEWVSVKGFANGVNPFALEELALRLGELEAFMWLGHGTAAPPQFGFSTNAAQLSVELRGEKPQVLTIEFGGQSPLLRPYASTVIAGQPTVFEFPWVIYDDLQRYFGLVAPGVNQRLRKAQPPN